MPEALDITCPCCEALLKVDPETGTVVWADPKKPKPKDFNDLVTRAQLAGAVALESAVLGAFGGALGLVVGSALTPVMVSSLRILSGLDLPVRGAGAHLGLFLAGACALAVASGLYPIWRMNRMDAVRAVRTG